MSVYLRFLKGTVEKTAILRLQMKKEATRGDKASSVVKRPGTTKDWKSSSKKSFKEPALTNSESKRDSKKKSSGGSKDNKEATLLAKQLSNRLFSGVEVIKGTKKSEKKKDSASIPFSIPDNSNSKRTVK